MKTKAELPMNYDNYVFDLYGTLVDIHTDENKEEIWERLAMFYGYYGALYESEELKNAYKKLVSGKELALKSELADNPKYEHESSPEIEITDVFMDLYKERGLRPPMSLLYIQDSFSEYWLRILYVSIRELRRCFHTSRRQVKKCIFCQMPRGFLQSMSCAA